MPPWLALVLSSLLSPGCAETGRSGSPPAASQPLPAHHTADGFRNRDGSTIDKSLWEVWRWQLSRQDPPRPDPPLPAASPDLATPGPNVTWLGHSTVLARLAGLAVITDPHFSPRASPFSWAGPRRVYPPPLTPAQLPHIDVVLVSHNPYDHLDEASVLARQAGRGGFDLALIPVGCYEPRDFMRTQHVNPLDAAQIHLDLGAKRSIGVHWGTFEGLCDEPLDQAPRDLAAARQRLGLAETAFGVLRRGETWAVAPR